MASTLPPAPASSATPPRDFADASIDDRLASTSRQLKTFEFLATWMMWIGMVFGILLTALLVDHWVMELGSTGRVLCFLALIGTTTWFLVARWLPLLLRRINPVYAAQSIEGGAPQIKNSLVNYLFLRDRPADSAQVVLNAVAQQAAGDLQQTDPELAVDRSHFIRAGCFLVAMFSAVLIYSVVSSKSSWATVQRVMAPWSAVARPSRVVLSDVSGDIEVLYGSQAKVSCKARGLRAEEQPIVHFSSLDGTLNDQTLPMQEADGAWSVMMPEGGATRHLRYHIEVGDGRSADHQIVVLPIPTVTVTEIRHQPPRYTRLPARTEPGGDIRGVQWSKVAIVATTSQAAESGTLRLHKADGSGAADIRMTVAGKRQLQAELVLELSEDGQLLYDRYHIDYKAASGHDSQEPIEYSIDVAADLPPVVSILEPQTPAMELPRNQTADFVVRALDPDYGIRKVEMEGESAGTIVWKTERQFDAELGQLVERFRLAPKSLGLQVGDEVVCSAIAVDNRGEGLKGVKPHRTQSESIRIRIIEPVVGKGDGAGGTSSQDPDAAGAESNDPGNRDENKPGETAKDGNDRKDDESPPNGNDRNDGSGDETGGKNNNDENNNDATKEPGGEGAEGGAGTGEATSDPSGESSREGDAQNGDPSGDSRENGADPAGQAGPNGQGQSAGDNSAGQSPNVSGNPQDGREANGNAGDSGSSGSDSGSGTSGGASRSNASSASSATPEAGDVAPDGPSEPLHDGEVIERLAEKLKDKLKGMGEQDQPGDPSSDSSNGESQGGAGKPGQGTENFDNTTDADANGDPAGRSPTRMSPQPGDSSNGNRPDGEAQDTEGSVERDLGNAKSNGVEQGDERGGSPQGAAENKTQENPKNEPAETPSTAGKGDNGDGAEGADSETKAGSPASQEQNRPNNSPSKSKQADSQTAPDEPASPSQSKRQSQMESGKTGDQSGAGAKGGGQGGKKKGNDSAGSTTSGDEGAGASPESGQGETGAKAGDKKKSGGATGASGAEQGAGSSTRNAESGVDGGADGTPAGRDPKEAGSGNGPTGTKGGGSGPVTGGGLPSDNESGGGYIPPVRTPRDKANLEYARKATDLVLEYLEDQEQKPDPALLDDLGWTENDLQAFLKRWRSMKQAAGVSDAAKRQLDDALSGLGLQSPANRNSVESTTSDQLQQIDAGARTAPPSRYREKFKSFRQRKK